MFQKNNILWFAAQAYHNARESVNHYPRFCSFQYLAPAIEAACIPHPLRIPWLLSSVRHWRLPFSCYRENRPRVRLRILNSAHLFSIRKHQINTKRFDTYRFAAIKSQKTRCFVRNSGFSWYARCDSNARPLESERVSPLIFLVSFAEKVLNPRKTRHFTPLLLQQIQCVRNGVVARMDAKSYYGSANACRPIGRPLSKSFGTAWSSGLNSPASLHGRWRDCAGDL